MEKHRFFGLIPAAGQSRRMGSNKLLLPWNGNRVIDAVLQSWLASRTDRIFLISREEAPEISTVRDSRIRLLRTPDTADMKATVQNGLRQIEETEQPSKDDYCLIAPADIPTISATLIDQVIDAALGNSRITSPTFNGKRGHPICFPWPLTQQLFDLGSNEGIKHLLDRVDVQTVPVDPKLRPRDIDTPEDYQRELTD